LCVCLFGVASSHHLRHESYYSTTKKTAPFLGGEVEANAHETRRDDPSGRQSAIAIIVNHQSNLHHHLPLVVISHRIE
jgi:hypothetical protein